MIILRVAYGYKVESTEDPLLKIPLSVLENFSIATAPGKWLVDIIPARELSHIPDTCKASVSSIPSSIYP